VLAPSRSKNCLAAQGLLPGLQNLTQGRVVFCPLTQYCDSKHGSQTRLASKCCKAAKAYCSDQMPQQRRAEASEGFCVHSDSGLKARKLRWLCSLTFELSGGRRRGAWAARRMMTLAALRPKCLAGGSPLERRVRESLIYPDSPRWR
jgi:hypothetical protein